MESLTVSFSKELAYKKILYAADELDLKLLNKTNTSITFRNEGSLFSYENSIIVKLYAEGEHTKITISSESSNDRLEQSFKKTINSNLK